METRQQRLIRQALERGRHTEQPRHDGNDGNDGKHGGAGWRTPEHTSLRKKSLRRTDPDYLPRTLTAHEWEEYYRQHGVPPEHRRAATGPRDDNAASDELTGHRRTVD